MTGACMRGGKLPGGGRMCGGKNPGGWALGGKISGRELEGSNNLAK